MHLVLVTETFPPEINGVALTVQSLLNELLAAGHQVTLVRPRQKGEQTLAMATGYGQLLTTGIPIPRYPGLRFGLPAGSRLRRLFRSEKVDAVYVATEGPLGWSALRAARACGLPVASGFHTRFDDYFRHYGAPWLSGLALAWMRRFHNLASCTLVPTESLRQWLLERGFARVELLRRAVDTQLFSPQRRDAQLRAELSVPADAPLVLAVGRIAAEKNLELLLTAFERIRALAPKARMLWVGDGPARADLQQRHPDQLFAGVLRGELLARHFASADLFVFPSLSETFGNVTLEAMASGVVVCAFDYAAAHEHIVPGESGYLADCQDPAGFLSSVELATRDWLAGRRLGAPARTAVEHLSPRKVAEDLVSLFGRLKSELQQETERRNRHVAAVHSTIL